VCTTAGPLVFESMSGVMTLGSMEMFGVGRLGVIGDCCGLSTIDLGRVFVALDDELYMKLFGGDTEKLSF
jgi:hypothetical protein